MSDKYNGWHNYETWVVNLWMDNERGQQDYWLENARQCFDEADADVLFLATGHHSPRGRRLGQLTKAEKAAIALADRLKDEHEEAATEMLRQANYEAGPLSDLLTGALGQVNWHEIASHWIIDAKEAEACTK